MGGVISVCDRSVCASNPVCRSRLLGVYGRGGVECSVVAERTSSGKRMDGSHFTPMKMSDYV